MDGALEPLVLAVPLVPTDIPDIDETVDEMDSVESFRCSAPDGRLGGNTGEG